MLRSTPLLLASLLASSALSLTAAAAELTVDTVAGGGIGDGFINSANALSIDPAGAAMVPGSERFLVIERSPGRIRRGDISDTNNNYQVETVVTGLVDPTAICHGPNHFYVADQSNIYRYSADGSTVSMLVGIHPSLTGLVNDHDAVVDAPQAMILHSSGDLLVADTGKNRIIRIFNPASSSPTWKLICGSETVTEILNAPAGLAEDPYDSETLWISDTGNNQIKYATGISNVTPPTPMFFTGDPDRNPGLGEGTPATGGLLNGPRQMMTVGTDYLAVCDTDNNRIVFVVIHFSASTFYDETHIGLLAGDTAGASGNVFGDKYFGDLSTSAWAIPVFSSPQGLVAIDDESGFVCDPVSGRVHRMRFLPNAQNTLFATEFGTGTPTYAGDNWYSYDSESALDSALSNPTDVNSTSDGEVVVTDTGHHRLRRFIPAALAGGTNHRLELIAGSTGPGDSGDGGTEPEKALFNTPESVAELTVAGTTYSVIADTVNGRVRVFNHDSGELFTPSDLIGVVARPVALAASSSGVYIADPDNHQIHFYDVANDFSYVAVGTGGKGNTLGNPLPWEADITEPDALAWDENEKTLYFTSGNLLRTYDDGSLDMLVLSGGGSETALYTPATDFDFGEIDDLAVDPIDGDLYIAQADQQRILRVQAGNHLVGPFAGSQFQAGFDADGVLASEAHFNQPTGLAATDDALYVADAANDRIRRINVNAYDSMPSLAAPLATVTVLQDAVDHAIDVTVNDFEGHGRIVLIGDVANGNLSQQPLSGGGQGSTFLYTPAPGFVGSDSFTVAVTDSQEQFVVETITIDVVDNPVLVDLASASISVDEGDAGDVTITLDRVFAFDVSVQLAASGAAATDIGNLGPHLIPAGVTELVVALSTIEDEIDEADQNASVVVDSVTSDGSTVIGSSSVTITIVDDDEPAPPAVTVSLISSTNSVTEGESIGIAAILDQATTVPVTVNLITNNGIPADQYSLPSSLTIPTGSTSAAGALTIIEDDIDEDDAILAIAIGSATGDTDITVAPGGVLIDVIDDDTVDLPPTTPSVNVASTGPFLLYEWQTTTIRLTLSELSSEAITLGFSASGGLSDADFTGIGSVVIPAGSTTYDMTLSVADDSQAEGPEIGSLTLSSISSGGVIGSATTISLELRDNDADAQAVGIALLDGADPSDLQVNKAYRVYVYGGSGTFTFTAAKVGGSATGPNATGIGYFPGLPLRGTYDLNSDGLIDRGQVVWLTPTEAGTSSFTARNQSDPVDAATIDLTATTMPTTAMPMVTIPTSGGTTVYTAVGGVAPERLQALFDIASANSTDDFKAGHWDAISQQFIDLPAMQAGDLRPTQAFFVATRIATDIGSIGTPGPVPAHLALAPGWNFIALPLLTDDNSPIPLSSFTLRDEAGITVAAADRPALIGGFALDWNGSRYVTTTSLVAGRGYWLNNASSDPAQMLTLDLTSVGPFSAGRPSSGYRTNAASGRPPAPSAASGTPPSGGCGVGMALLLPALLALGLIRFHSAGRRRT